MSKTMLHSGCLGTGLRVGGIIIAVLVLVFVALAIHQRIALRRFREQTPPPGRLVDVDGRTMHLRCTGSGSPTVVIDAGNACFSLEWAPIQDELSAVTRVCTFDRAGYGWSDAGPSPRDGAAAVADLHALLQAAGESGLYVLVGHSLGGTHARLYAAHGHVLHFQPPKAVSTRACTRHSILTRLPDWCCSTPLPNIPSRRSWKDRCVLR